MSKVVSMTTRVMAVGPGGQFAGSGHAVQLRHTDVHQCHVGPQSSCGSDGCDAVGDLGRHGDVSLGGEDQAKAGSDEMLVVGSRACAPSNSATTS
jgi:hypothetical protein